MKPNKQKGDRYVSFFQTHSATVNTGHVSFRVVGYASLPGGFGKTAVLSTSICLSLLAKKNTIWFFKGNPLFVLQRKSAQFGFKRIHVWLLAMFSLSRSASSALFRRVPLLKNGLQKKVGTLILTSQIWRT